MRDHIRFLLNGRDIRVSDAAPDTSLLRWLRAQGLTAAKEGCNEGDCGACTVALGEPGPDGFSFRAVNACLLFLPQVDGKAVITAEGLGGAHPAQTLLAEKHGTQCGFCSPGIALSLFALSRTPARGREEVLDALAGNLCRCTGYRPIVEAAQALPVMTAPEAEAAQARALLDAAQGGLAYEADGIRYGAPERLEDVLALRAEWPGAWLLAGGTDLALRVTKAGQRPPAVISLDKVTALRVAEDRADALVLGAALTYAEALPLLDRRQPAFAALVRRIGAGQVRAKGTLGGNIANASPIGDTMPALIALGATLVTSGPAGERRVAVEDFFTGYRATVLAGDEILAAIEIPHAPSDRFIRSYKLAKRVDQDISTVAASFALDLDCGRVAGFRAGLGGVAAVPLRARGCEAALLGRPWTAEDVEHAALALDHEIAPISDFRGSAAYRRETAGNLLRRFFLESRGETVRLEDLA